MIEHPIQPMKMNCAISPFSEKEQEMIQRTDAILEEEQQSAKILGVTVERLREFRAYVKTLRTKFPHMKQDRIARKAAEYFKIKLQ